MIIIAFALQNFSTKKSILRFVEDVVHDRGRVQASEAGLHPFARLWAKERGIVCAQRRQSLIDYDCGEGVFRLLLL